jgi:hypothetical protein
LSVIEVMIVSHPGTDLTSDTEIYRGLFAGIAGYCGLLR